VQLAVDYLVVSDAGQWRRVDVDGHGACLMLHSVDAGGRGGERLARSVLGDATRAIHDERLRPRTTLEQVDADAGAAMVVEAGVAWLPPGVEPRFRMIGAPEELERALTASLECREVDEVGGGSSESGALLGGEYAGGGGESIETSPIDHGVILTAEGTIVQDRE
jgi:hypothetical protein